jgi:hypothetical protein
MAAGNKFQPKGKRSLGKLQLEWNREVDLLNRRIRAAERQGYVFADKSFIPQAGARASRSKIEKLRRLRKDELLKYSTVYENGKAVKGSEVAKRKRREAARKARAAQAAKLAAAKAPTVEPAAKVPTMNVSRHVINTFFDGASQFKINPFYGYVFTFLEGLETKYSETEFASIIEGLAAEGIQVDWATTYYAEDAQRFVTDVTGYLERRGLMSSDSRSEVLDYYEVENWQDYDK